MSGDNNHGHLYPSSRASRYLPVSCYPLRGFQVHALCTLVLTSACLGCSKPGTPQAHSIFSDVDERYIQPNGQLIFVNNAQIGCKLAAKHGMPCLFFFTAEWCTYCHRMAETAFADRHVGQLGQSFVCVLIDADREPELCQHFAVSAFPTVEFVSPDGQSLHRLVGQQSSSDLVAGMRSALARFAWRSNTLVR
jgi:thiol:disulfide interchange protein